MDHSWLRTVTVVLLGALAIKCASALQVELYSEENYSGYLGGIQKQPGNDTDCYTLDQQITFKSIKTDKCLMMYADPQCKSISGEDKHYSFRIYKDTSEFRCSSDPASRSNCGQYEEWHHIRQVQSLSVCSQERGGGPALDVDYYQAEAYEGKLLQQWRDVCTCQNIPEGIRGGAINYISFDNHGNDMEVFAGENCQGDSAFIPAGDSLASWFVIYISPTSSSFDVASFRPTGLTHCIKLDASIVKFSFQNGTSEPPIPKKVKLATSGQIINNGAAETQEQYQLTESVTETVEFTIATGYTKMNTVGVSASASVKADAGVPLVGDVEITASISADYNYQWGSSSSNTTTSTVSKTTTIQVTQTITVPGCHNCTVSTFVKQASNFPINYTSYSEITGVAGSSRMSAAQIKANLPDGVTYVKDVDEYTVEAVTGGTMYAQFGLQTLMDIDCDKIPNCSPKAVYKGPSTFHYKFPFEATKKRNWKATAPQCTSAEIGSCMGTNWNSLAESSFPF